MLSETASSSLRRIKLLNNIISSNNNSIKFFNKRNYTDVKNTENDEVFIKIGDTVKEIKKVKSLDKVPKGYLSLYGGKLNESQQFLKSLKWLMQKDELRQDCFLIGSPPGAWRRQLAMYYAELTKREVEYLCLTRDTTESDIKQRREITAGSVIYANQCAVSAALNGRLLIIEGIEKAERNLLPILNNLLENRELNLDDGHFLIAPDRYDKLIELAKKNNVDLSKLNLLRVHEDFRVIAIGLPTPKYKGNPLDPPLRSRFQARLINYPTYEDYLNYLISISPANKDFIENITGFAYSFYEEEINKINLPDFPIENIEKLVTIVNKCQIMKEESSSSIHYLNTSFLINKLYPHKILLKNGETNLKLYFGLLEKFNLISSKSDNIQYKLLSIEDRENDEVKVNFESKSESLTKTLHVILSKVRKNYVINQNSGFIINDYHSHQLVDLMLSHSAGYDFCLIGSRGCGKTQLINEFSRLLGYNTHTIQLYKDMTSRDLIQQRITLLNGDTKWYNSVLIDACLNGDLCVLDGIHRVRDDTILAIKRLVQDRELDLMDGRKLIRHDKYDLIEDKTNLLRIHPSFRLIAVAEPPTNTEKTVATSGNWLTSELVNMFLFHIIEPLSLTHEYELLNKKFSLNEKHRQLYNVINNLKQMSLNDPQLKQTANIFSLRQLIRLSHKLEAYPSLNLKELIENSCLYKFMPQLNKQILSEFLRNQNLLSETESTEPSLNDLLASFNEYKLNSDSIQDLAKVPDTLFFNNKLHTRILNNLLRDFKLGEHLLLIGNQGTGKNKLVDKFLMLLNRPREYIQLHRDTTVHTLTVQPQIKGGIVTYEDSPLVKAAKAGHILVIDEADKASIQVTCILKSLIETGEMMLSDGRLIVPYSSTKMFNNNQNIIQTHKNFRIIILANRPGFPFLGNDFFSIIGDILSCHTIDNPDIVSEIELLKMYAPNVSDQVLQKLVNAFSSLRELSDQGLITYPYSTRELVNIVKHLEKYPNDSLANVIGNISDFDQFNDLKSTFKQVMNKHGIPVRMDSQISINLVKSIPMPAILPLSQKLKIENESKNLAFSDTQLSWKLLGGFSPVNTGKEAKIDKKEERVGSFNELRTSWNLPINKQNSINDFLMVNSSTNDDIIYVNTLKPINLLQFNLNTNEHKLVDLNKYFPLAWRTYYPKIRLLAAAESNQVYLFDEVLNSFFKVDFKTSQIFELNRINFLNKAKKTMSKYFTDQNQAFKLLPIEFGAKTGNYFLSFKSNSTQIELINLNKNYQLDIELNMKVFNVSQISKNLFLIISNKTDSSSNGHYLLKLPEKFFNLETNYTNEFDLFKIDNIFNSTDDQQLSQTIFKGSLNDDFKTLFQDKVQNHLNVSTVIPSIYHHFVVATNINENLLKNSTIETYFCRRETSIEQNHYRRTVEMPIVQSIVNYKTNTILTQLPLYAKVSSIKGNKDLILGYLEIVDLNDKTIRYLEIPKPTEPAPLIDESSSYLNVVNEADYLLQVSPSNDNVYTLDFHGCLREWEISKLHLERSLDEWYKLVTDKENQHLTIEAINKATTSEETLKDLRGPKHGKVDLKNAPHVGGNTWAGGSGGRDTAGLGGVGGPYRLDSGNPVFQVSDEAKQQVPEHVRKAARDMAQKAFRERLREIEMSEYEHSVYSKYLDNVKKPVQQLRNILNGLEAKKKERQWLKHQTNGN